MISITVFVIYVIVALIVYATLKSIKEDLDDISVESDDTFERGLARATIGYFLENYK